MYAQIINLFNNDLRFKSFIALLNQQEIKILNIVVFLAIIIIFFKKSMVVSFLQG